MYEVIKESTKHNKKNVPYARFLSELFHQSRLVETLMNLGVNEDMEIIYGNILSVDVLGNMNIIKKKDVIHPPSILMIRNDNIEYIYDFPVISKMDNPEVINQYIKFVREEIRVTLAIDDVPKGNVYKLSRKREQVASESEKVLHKPPKRKVVQIIEVMKEVQEVVSTTVLMPTKTKSGATGKTPHKTTSYELPVKKKKLRKIELSTVHDEDDEEDEQLFLKEKKVVNKDALNIPQEDV